MTSERLINSFIPLPPKNKKTLYPQNKFLATPLINNIEKPRYQEQFYSKLEQNLSMHFKTETKPKPYTFQDQSHMNDPTLNHAGFESRDKNCIQISCSQCGQNI